LGASFFSRLHLLTLAVTFQVPYFTPMMMACVFALSMALLVAGEHQNRFTNPPSWWL
jgi:hypothetical protein